jgi:hypothetical protein
MNTQLEIAKRSKKPRMPSQGRHTGLIFGPPTVKRQVSSYYDAETAIFKLMTLTYDSAEPVRYTTAYRSTIAGTS